MTRYLLPLLLALAVPAGAAMNRTIVVDQAVTATGDLKTIQLGSFISGTCTLRTTAVAGTSPTLDVYLQSTVGGVDDDYCRFTQISGVGSQVARFPAPASTSGIVALSDRSSGLTAGTCRAGHPGSQLKVAAVLGGTAGPSVTITLTCDLQN